MTPGQLVRATTPARWAERPLVYVGRWRDGRTLIVRDGDRRERCLSPAIAGPLCASCTTEIDRGRRRLRARCATCDQLRENAERQAPAGDPMPDDQGKVVNGCG